MNNFTPEYLSKTIKSIENFKAFKIEDEIPYQKAVLEVVNEILIVHDASICKTIIIEIIPNKYSDTFKYVIWILKLKN